MKLGIISDTHGSLTYFNKALSYLNDCEYILHAGDVLYHGPRNPLPDGYNPKELAVKINSLNNLIFASGNCDSDVDQMVINHPIQTPFVFSKLNDLNILICHGYRKSKEDTIKMAKDYNADILISGHTHVKELYKDGSLIVLNPGSTSLPKDGTHSIAIVEDNSIKLINIITGEILKEMSIL